LADGLGRRALAGLNPDKRAPLRVDRNRRAWV